MVLYMSFKISEKEQHVRGTSSILTELYLETFFINCDRKFSGMDKVTPPVKGATKNHISVQSVV